MFFFKVGLNAPLVISPTCSESQTKMIFQKLHLPEVGLGAHCFDQEIHAHERYSPVWMLPHADRTFCGMSPKCSMHGPLWLIALFVLFKKKCMPG